MSTLAERLKEERNRLGLNQADFGAKAGVSRETQINYESGSREPKTGYLAAITEIGVDVMYILTGVRMMPIPTQEPIKAEEESVGYEASSQVNGDEDDFSQQEKVIVKKLRKLPQHERDEIQDLVEKAEQAHVSKVNFKERFRKAS